MDRNSKNNTSEIMHVGVLGMRWGVRRGSSNSGATGAKKATLSDAEIKEGRRRTAKKALIIGSAAVGVGLAAYGGYKLAKYAKSHSKEISDAKNLIKAIHETGKSLSKSPTKSYSPAINKPYRKPARNEAELRKGIAKTMAEIKSEGSRRSSSKIDIKKYLMDNDKIYRDLISGQQQHEAKWGPPSAADLQFARESLQRQGVKFP